MVQTQSAALGHAGVAIAWGLVVMTMIYAIGDLSGAHMNPAVSWAFVATGRFAAVDAAAYTISQIAGAIAAAISLATVFGIDPSYLGATLPTVSPTAAFCVETFLTAVLMFVVMGVSTGAKEKSITAGLAVGGVIAMEAMVAGPITMASMNPARSIGPALIAGRTTELWLYVMGPMFGAMLGLLAYRIVGGAKR